MACKIDGCNKNVRCKQLCEKHYCELPEIKEKRRIAKQLWYQKNKTDQNIKLREWRAKNPKLRKLQDERYQTKNKARLKDISKRWRLENPDKTAAQSRRAYLKNRQKRIEYQTKRIQENPQANISHRLRSRINNALRQKTISKTSHLEELVGCSVPFLVSYLKSMFSDGMTWENRKEWHIDHIIPLASFDLSDPEQLKKACHYSNLQPLWAKDNLKKGCKII